MVHEPGVAAVFSAARAAVMGPACRGVGAGSAGEVAFRRTVTSPAILAAAQLHARLAAIHGDSIHATYAGTKPSVDFDRRFR